MGTFENYKQFINKYYDIVEERNKNFAYHIRITYRNRSIHCTLQFRWRRKIDFFKWKCSRENPFSSKIFFVFRMRREDYVPSKGSNISAAGFLVSWVIFFHWLDKGPFNDEDKTRQSSPWTLQVFGPFRGLSGSKEGTSELIHLPGCRMYAE